MNPFEQLRLLTVSPHQVFEDIALAILRFTVGNVRRVRVYRGDGGVDGFTGTYGEVGAVDVYQVKYFPDPFGPSQKQQIREAYQTAANSPDFKMLKWFLCVPSRLTKEDVRWFDEWTGAQAVPCAVIDGDDLKDRLDRDECEPIRRQLVALGVGGLPAGAPKFTAKVIVQPVRADSGLTAALTVVLTNEGSRSASEIRVEVSHSDTNTLAWMENGDAWARSANDGGLNPRRLRGLHALNPDEPSPVLSIPLSPATEFPIDVDLKLWAQDTPSVSLKAIVAREATVPGNRIEFIPAGCSAQAIPSKTTRPEPTSENAIKLLQAIREHDDRESRGLTLILDQISGPLILYWMPHTQQSGKPIGAKKRDLLPAIEELQSLGWLAEPEDGGKVLVYEYLGS